ncbi:MAG: hypothetical protein IKD04_02680 [Clostridia bacterium]|nr:hypothetical protein [Clostridia bacterium]
MIKKIGKRLLPMLLAVLLIASALPLTAFAADVEEITGILGADGSCNIQIEYKKSGYSGSATGTYSEDKASYTATATSNSRYTTATNNITITNKSNKKAKIRFDYAVENATSFKIDNTAYSGTGTYESSDINHGSTITIALQAKNATATVTLSNFSLLVSMEAFDVTVNYNSTLGSVAVDSTTVENGTTQGIIASTGAVFTATPVSGASFLGWINTANNQILTQEASLTFNPETAMTIEAIFINSGSKPHFMVDTKYLFDDLNNAATAGSTVVLMNDATLPAGDYTIPSGATLLIPFDSANTLYTTDPGHDDGTTDITPTPYRTLKMADGANITVNGAISLSAKHREAQGSGYGCENSGAYGCINMATGSNITINNGATLYAWGFITGDGNVVANSGARVFEYFQFRDFRGGSISTAMEAEYGVFLFSQYYVQNIEVPLTLYAGAIEKTYTTLTMANYDFSEDITFIGSSDAMFTITEGSVTKRYDGSKDRLIIEANGDFSVSPISIEIGNTITSILGQKIDINTVDYELPITNNLTVIANSGTVTLGQDIALLPGSEIVVGKDATCVLGQGINVYVYDADEWGTYTFSKNGNGKFYPLRYAPGRTYTRTEADLVDAKIQVEGLVDASAGYVYTTAGGANIFSTGEGKVITVAGTQTVTYQFVQGSDYTADSNKAIPITPAKAKNADGSYAETTSATTATTYTYNSTHGKWDDKNHTVTDVVTKPTCTEQGFTTHTCTCGYSYVDSYVAATGHSYNETVKEPTCTENGHTTHTCSVCGDSYIDSEVEAIGHSHTAVVTAPTCTEQGFTTYTCNCGDTYTDDYVVATGHSYNSVVTAPTCTEGGYTTHTCANCGDSYVDSVVEATGHSYDAVVTEPTCTEGGYTTHTCSACGDSYVDSQVEATGHNHGDWIIDEKATHYVEGSKHRECSCGHTETEAIPVIVCDIDGNSVTNGSELSSLQKHMLNTDSIADDKIYMFDMDCNGEINIIDLIKLKKFIAGKS